MMWKKAKMRHPHLFRASIMILFLYMHWLQTFFWHFFLKILTFLCMQPLVHNFLVFSLKALPNFFSIQYEVNTNYVKVTQAVLFFLSVLHKQCISRPVSKVLNKQCSFEGFELKTWKDVSQNLRRCVPKLEKMRSI